MIGVNNRAYGQSVYPTPDSRSRYDITVKDNPCKMIPVIFTVDSQYRNYAVAGRMGPGTPVYSQTTYPIHAYTVPLPSTYRDMVSIELIAAHIPRPSASCDVKLDSRYLILSIGFSSLISNNPAVVGSLCNLYPDGEGYRYSRGSNDPDAGYTYFFPEPGLVSKLDIRLTYPDGSVPDFQASDAHVLTFELRGLNQPKVILC